MPYFGNYFGPVEAATAPTAEEVAAAVRVELATELAYLTGPAALETTAQSILAEFTALASDTDIADAVWDEARAGHTTNGTYGDTAEWASNVNASVAISATEAEQVAQGSLALRTFHTFSQAINSTSAAALNTATKVWLAIKVADTDADSAAVVFVEAAAGLTVLAGAAYGTAAHGTLAVGGSAGAWEITIGLDEVATGLLAAYVNRNLVAELKAKVGASTIFLWSGKARISQGIVRATS